MPASQPKKYVPFAPQDSRAIEDAYQRLLKEDEQERGRQRHRPAGSDPSQSPLGTSPCARDTSPHVDTESRGNKQSVRVPVNEDFLFDVDVIERELAPAYWLGPTYDVRRGSWFFQEGATLRPCEENLAAQLEEVSEKPSRSME